MIKKYDIGKYEMNDDAWFDLYTVEGAMEEELREARLWKQGVKVC